MNKGTVINIQARITYLNYSISYSEKNGNSMEFRIHLGDISNTMGIINLEASNA